LEDFSSIEKFATTIKSSPIVGDIRSGLGAKRKCVFNDGSSLVEGIIEFNQGQDFIMALSEYSLPLKSIQATMHVKAIDTNSSELSMSSELIVKGGPLGWLIRALMMRPMMKGVFRTLMSGLVYHVVTSELVGEKAPSNGALENIVMN
jgi:hypothetical protein